MPKQDLDAISRAYPDDENEVNFENEPIACAIKLLRNIAELFPKLS